MQGSYLENEKMSSFFQTIQMTDPPAQLIPGLPEDVALWCLARIPRSYHPIISLVCKSWHSILRSSPLFHTRLLLGATETFLYLNLRHHSSFHWYVLIHKSPTKRCLIRLPSLPIQTQNTKSILPNDHFTPINNQDIRGQMVISYHDIASQPIQPSTTNSPITQSFFRNDHFTPINNFSNKEIRDKMVISHNKIATQPIGSSSTKNTPITQPFMHNDYCTPIDNLLLGEIKGKMVLSHNKTAAQPIEPSSTGKSPIIQPFGLSHLLNGPKRQPIGPSFAVYGSNIYLIGGSHNEIPSNSMWVFDCRFNVWEPGPKMRVGREFSAAGVVDGKIYVMGGCVVDNWARSMNWAEVFDPVKGSWAPVPSPIEVRDKWMHASAVIGGKVYAMADRGGVVFDVRKGEWGGVSERLDLGWRGRVAVVGGVLYCYDYLGKIRGYDVEEDRWNELRGVGKGLPKFLCGATMVNFDGRLCVVWEGKGSGKEVEIMCAEIEVKKDVDGGLSGVILWCGVILVVPNSASIVQCLVVEL